MEIIFVSPNIKIGGGNRVFIELANKLINNYNIKIIYPQNSSDINTFNVNKDIQFIGIGKMANSKIAKLINLIKCIYYINKLPNNNIIVFSDPIFCLLIPLIRNKNRIYRFIQADDYCIFDDGLLLGNGFLLTLYKKLCKLSYKLNIKYIFNSKFVYNQFVSISHKKEVPFNLVHPSINHDVFKVNLIAKDIKKDCFSVCIVARKHPSKGLITFINAYNQLPNNYKKRITDIKLISHDDLSDYNTKGMNIIKPRSDNEIAKIFLNSNLFISTSWLEGFGLPPLEAMACGCPVITSDSKGIHEFAIDEYNCLMYEPKNELQLIEKIKFCIDNSDICKKLSLNGIKTADKFNWDLSAQQFINIISK